jgi:hypothetical protein
MPSLLRSLGLVSAIFNEIWTMNSIALCYPFPCYCGVCTKRNDRQIGRGQIERFKIVPSVDD